MNRILNKIAVKTQKIFLSKISFFEQNNLSLKEVHIKKSQSVRVGFFFTKKQNQNFIFEEIIKK